MEAATIERAHGERSTSTLAHHPTFDYIASTSFDQTWKLWDANTHEELLVQEGHSKLVLCGAFQPDGSIFCSGSQDAMALVGLEVEDAYQHYRAMLKQFTVSIFL